MVVQNCGWCKGPEADVTELSCLCKSGYMNQEGTFIPGSLVRSGRALSKDDYEKHQHCKTCNHNASPLQCKWRQEHLSPVTQQESHEEDGCFHFFVPSKRIATEVLEAFVKENGGEKGESAAGKLFKGEEGFIVTARFRFNSQDIVQLQELSERRRQGRSMKTESFARKSRNTHRRLNEFTHFLQGTTGREPEVRAPPQQLLNPVQSGRHRSAPTVSNPTHFKSPSDNNRREVKESVSELTSAVRRVSVSDRSLRDIPASGIYTRRQDQDHGSSDSTYQHGPGTYPEESTGAHCRESHARQGDNEDEVSQPTTIFQHRTPGRHTTSYRHHRDTILSQAAIGQGSFQRSGQLEISQYASIQPARTQSDPTRRDTLYRERHSAHVSKQSDGRGTYVSSMPAPFQTRPSERPARDVSEGEDSDAAESRTTRSSTTESRTTRSSTAESRTTHSSTVAREPFYRDRHSTPASQQREGRDLYVSPVPTLTHQKASRRPIREESESEDSDATEIKRKQPEYNTHDSLRGDRRSHPTERQPREPDTSAKPAPKIQARRKPTRQESDSETDSEDAADVKRIKFFIPSEGLDLTVLAFYLRLCIDSNATVKQGNHKGKDGFIVEAKRAVTTDELADMMRDTKGWLSEKRRLSSRDAYVDSETAKQRRKKAGRKR